MLRDYVAYFKVMYCIDGESREEAGFYPSNSFAEAASFLEEFYGEDLEAITHLEIVDSAMITMPVECAQKALEHVFGQGGRKCLLARKNI